MLKLKTLGGLRIVDERDQVLSLPGQRAALLAVLIVAGQRGTTRDRVAALLWPESTDEKARHSLGQSLYALRRDVAATVVLGTSVLRLDPGVASCDAWDMEALARAGALDQAVELYSGPFLNEVSLRGSAELEHLVDGERERLARIHREALASLAREATVRGETGAAVAWRRRLAAADPLSSQAALELVRALAEMGDKAAALQAARVHESLVRQEFDSAPDPKLLEYVRLLRTEPLAPTASERCPATGNVSPVAASEFKPVRESGVVATEAAVPPSLTPTVPRARRLARRTVWSLVGLATVIAVAGARRYLASSPALDSNRVLVVGFENRTGDASLQFLGAMAREWIAQGLEQSGIIRVVAAPRFADAGDAHRADSGQVDGIDHSSRAAALGAGTLVTGAYYVVGDSLRFHVELSDVGRKEVLTVFDVTAARPADPVAPVDLVRQRTVAAVAALFDPRLASWVRIATKPPTYEAYRQFVTGQRIWASDYRKALSYFERAIAIDSSFYAARVEIAILHRLLGECDRTEAIAADLSRVRARLAPYDYHMLEAQIAQCRGQWEHAYEEARTVAELRPGSAFLDYAVALQALQLGRRTEAGTLLGRHDLARGVAEVGPNYAVVSALIHGTRGEFDRALAETRWVQQRYPTFAGPRTIEALLLARAGRVADSERALDSVAALPLRPPLTTLQALRRIPTLFAFRGDTAAARRGLSRAMAWFDARPEAERLLPAFQFELAQMLYDHGRLDEARAIVIRLVAADSANVDYRGLLGLIATRRGDTTAMAAADRWLATSRTAYAFRATYYRARIASLAGRHEALALLATALDETGRFTLPAIAENPDFVPLRNDPRFRRLVTLD